MVKPQPDDPCPPRRPARALARKSRITLVASSAALAEPRSRRRHQLRGALPPLVHVPPHLIIGDPSPRHPLVLRNRGHPDPESQTGHRACRQAVTLIDAAQLVAILESLTSMKVGSGVTTERKTRISQPDDGSARCRGSRAPDQLSGSYPSTPPPTTPSTFSVISPPPARTESSERRPCRLGVRPPPRLEASGAACFAAPVIRQRDKALPRLGYFPGQKPGAAYSTPHPPGA